MIKKYFIITLFICSFIPVIANYNYFSKIFFSIYQGYRHVQSPIQNDVNQLDFLNYVYTQSNSSDYQYLEFAVKLNRNDIFEIDARVSLHSILKPYCYCISIKYFNKHNWGLIAGSMANSYYFTDFDPYFTSLFEENISTRSIDRQWNFSLLSLYAGPIYDISYKTINLNMNLKGGLCSFIPLHQKNIIKYDQSNYKKVLEYQSSYNFAPFMASEIELFIELFKCKKTLWGIRTKFSYLITKNAINYQLNTYEWTYDSLTKQQFELPKHIFQQTDWDFGIFIRW
jgi:hypothetical protein